MNVINVWWKGIGLQAKLQLLIQGSLIVILLSAQVWVVHQFERRTLHAAEQRAVGIGDGAINGLNTLMDVTVEGKDFISDAKARARFIKQIGISDGLKELRVVRAKGTIDEFGPGFPGQLPVDNMDREVLASGKTQFKLNTDHGASLRAVMPFIAMKEFRTSKCLRCHGVEEGTVLGAASVTLDIQEDMAAISTFNTRVWIGQAALQVVLFFIVAVIVRSSLRLLGAEPVQAADLARSVAKGDLNRRIHLRAGDTNSLMAQLKAMQDSLGKVVGSVRQRAESVATASVEIAQGNNDLSVRTEQQASALQQTAASMEALGTQVKRNASSASRANQLAHDASTVAVKGGQVVGQVVETMKGINEASHKISEIISVIDAIAFQTNILALNAAVEAARAGDHGRGFAVVAAEVRSLAGRSAVAAKEIKVLITASVQRVELGTVQVDQAGQTIQEMVNSIQRVTDIMAEISAASSTQSEGVTQVGEAINQMDQVTQQNAALVEQMAAAAEGLRTQAQELVQTMSVFKLAARN